MELKFWNFIFLFLTPWWKYNGLVKSSDNFSVFSYFLFTQKKYWSLNRIHEVYRFNVYLWILNISGHSSMTEFSRWVQVRDPNDRATKMSKNDWATPDKGMQNENQCIFDFWKMRNCIPWLYDFVKRHLSSSRSS